MEKDASLENSNVHAFEVKTSATLFVSSPVSILFGARYAAEIAEV